MAPTAQNQNTKQTERAWNGSGGGFSRIYQAPDYQKTSLTSAQMQGSNNRGIPDIAAMADPNTGLAMYRNGQWSMAGGTSASVAVWAAIVAIASQMAGHPLGFINPTLYTLASSDTYTQNFRDITDGNNTNQKAGVQGYPAAGGWDAVTGLGVPRAGTLLTNLVFSLSISKQVG